jgi:osmotically-inducible protein OsmY
MELKEVLMKLLFAILVLLCATASLSQQQTKPAAALPDRMQAPTQQLPPETKAPAPGQVSSLDIEQELQKEFGRAPLLRGTQLKPSVDEQTIVLTGTVETQQQHDLALQLAQAYATERKLIDKITIRQKT